ncbi:MAG: DUF642 domain-containing protein [Actinomycetota bacterium]|nr:DUF642 domain-containing protein [Actinomycetota bacterium]
MKKFGNRLSVFAGAASLAAATVALAASPALATTGDFTNGNFTSGNFSTNALSSPGYDTLYPGGSSYLDGWTVTSGSVDLIGSYWTQPTTDTSGNAYSGYSLDMNGSPDSANPSTPGTISQTFTTVANATYEVQFLLAGNPTCGLFTKTLSVSATGGTSQSFSFINTSSTTQTSMGWTPEMYTFTANSATTTLTFAADTSNQSNCGPALADVTVTQSASATGAQCKDGGWQSMVDPNNNYQPFKNQGDCVSYYAVSGATPIGS